MPRAKRTERTTAKLKAIGYVRVSAVGGRAGAEYHTLELQRASIEKACRDRGYELVDVLTDENKSAASRKRPRVQRRDAPRSGG